MRRPVLALALLLAACTGGQGALERAVREYDEALIRAYATSDPSHLPEVATRAEANRVLVLVDLKKAARLVLESKLESFQVTQATSGEALATVETRERWRYHDRRLDPGEPPGTEFVAEMAMRYQLARDDGRWKVASVATVSSEYLEPRGARPGAQGEGHGTAGHGSGASPRP